MGDELLARLRLELKKSPKSLTFQKVDKVIHPSDTTLKLGRDALRKGLMATVVLAGGMGTRLKFNYPKGQYPISAVRKKTLFQLIAEKTLAASKAYKQNFEIAFMTSNQNHDETVSYFKDNANFGIHPSFFTQSELPFLDKEGNYIKSGTSIVQGPDGNGRLFEHLANSSILDSWEKKGIQYINVILVDNPLADPFDANLLGGLIESHDDVVFKAVQKESPEEKTGTFVKVDNQLKVIEYSEIDPREKGEHPYASISLFCLTLPFAKKLSSETFPLHIALKAVFPSSKEPDSYKFETFIFDLLDFTDKADCMLFPREETFAPLKNSIGPDSPSTVAHALESQDRRILSQLTSNRISNQPLELDAQFHYPTKVLVEKWKNREVDPSLHYIHEDQ